MLRWLAGLLCCVSVASAEVTLYVSPAGHDAWSGGRAEPDAARQDGPLLTVGAAQRTVRKLLLGRRGEAVTVLIRAGTYELPETLVFLPEDSGAAGAPVIYAAYPGETPLLSGGTRLRGWTVAGGRWTLALPEVAAGRWSFNSLWVNGRRRPRARIPNEGYLTMAGYDAATTGPNGQPVKREQSAFVARPGDLQPWRNLTDGVAVIYHSWETALQPLQAIEADRNILVLGGRSNWRFGYWGPNQRYRIENVPEALDAPGEWYLDRQAGTLTYLPLPGEDPATTEVVAPRLTELVRVSGDLRCGLPVSHLTFRGLRLEHSDWQLEPAGHSDPQAVCTLGSSITLTGAYDCRIENCELAHLSRYGVGLRVGSQACVLRGNHCHDLGAGAVRVGETGMPGDPGDVCGRHVIDNNYIHDYGAVYAGGVGIFLAQTSDNQVTHNEIHDGWYTGISVGWNWGRGETAAHRNLIADNHIHHIVKGVMSDAGGIYTLGSSPGTVLRHNHIHDIFAYEQPRIAWGIYLDAESNQITVEDNLVYHTTSGGLMLHNGAHASTIRNNIFARGADLLIWRSPQSIGVPNTFEHNVCLVAQGELFLADAVPDTKSTWNRNLYWRTDGRELLFMDDPLADWQARGLDRDSVVADPRFADPAAGDYRLPADSPAITQVGFQPFPLSGWGLTGDPAWVERPRRVTFAPTVLPPTVTRGGAQPVDDGFETTPLGDPPQRCVASLGGGGRIEVTAEQAATGQRCLAFRDAPGLTQTWEPHAYWQPNFRRGTARLTCRLRVGDGALPWIEWRSAGSPYQVGPSLKVDAANQLVANGRPLVAVPRDTWLTIEVTCRLGKPAAGHYDLTLRVGEAVAQSFRDLPCDPAFDRLAWLGFVSLADAVTTFWVDDLRVENPGT